MLFMWRGGGGVVAVVVVVAVVWMLKDVVTNVFSKIGK